MFDLTSSKLLLLGIVALIVIGPKDLPILLRTLGKYMGMIRRQADEFKDQFNEAMRESEFEQLKKDVESIGSEAETVMRDAESTVRSEIDAATSDFEKAIDDKAPDPDAHDANGMPIAQADATSTANEPAAISPASGNGALNGGNHPGEPMHVAVEPVRTEQSQTKVGA